MSQSSFDVATDSDRETGTTLVVGQTYPGLAGVTAADYLVRHLDSEQAGHVSTDALPAIAPLEAGVPRHHSRLYTLDDAPLSVLVGELFVPMGAARSYADALLAWANTQEVTEIAVLHGVPFAHGPDEHAVFHVATDGYRTNRLPDDVFHPLANGFLDGVAGELVTRGLDDAAPEVGVYLTPTHPPGPDVDASLRLLTAIESVYDFDVDESDLQSLSEQLREYYGKLAERLASGTEGEDALAGYDTEDGMYM
ncbi:proteasome assembly chaperone family protein [Halarchaeum salinum]|uniref:Proteasome assembly chaperone family protein n=1 Tax=Halarchaeum salinum TaxID=489912 RepID=A0AAV3S3J7_9EURY